jgi:hypothetical protein
MGAWDHHVLLFLAGAAALATVVLGLSCIGLTPAMGGKTKVRTDFVDKLDAQVDPGSGAVTEPGQNTEYHQTVEAPAGVDLQGLTNMGYDWSPDGSGKIVVSGQGNMSSAKQAEMLPVIAQAYAGALGAAYKTSIETLAPILGQFLADHGALQLWQAQNPKPAALDQVLGSIQDPDVRAWLTALLSRLPAPSAPAGSPSK